VAHWDIAALRAAQRDVRSLQGVTSEIARAARPGLEDLAVGAIAGRITSYGEAWAPLKNGGEASTSIAHRMTVVADGPRIRLRLDRVASYHSLGTQNMVARPSKPSDSVGIPQPWRTELTEQAAQVMASKVGDR
jgi:hypothetical protein